MTDRAACGSDLIVYLEGDDKTPEAVEVMDRCTEAGLRSKFGGADAVVFIKNKNLQELPIYLRGAILWLAVMKVISVVIKANGEHAYVEILFPASRKGEKLTIATKRLEGAYLQQILGSRVMEFDQKFRPKDINPNTGHVVTPVDKNGCVKMSFRGPDIGVLESLDVPVNDALTLAEDPFAKLDTSKLPPNPDKGKDHVPVVYIYSPCGRDQYKFVQEYMKDCDFGKCLTCDELESTFNNDTVPNDKFECKPAYCVPLGSPISANSDR
jgi:hypothetical protein